MSKITIDRAVLEQALEALFMYKPMVTGVTFQHGLDAMQALRAALEQPVVEQEPVRVFFPRNTPQHGEDWAIDPAFLHRVLHSIDPDTPYEFTPSPEQIESTLLALEAIPSSIYTHPQPPRQPLTDDEINTIWRNSTHITIVEVVRAIEAAHGIGGES